MRKWFCIVFVITIVLLSSCSNKTSDFLPVDLSIPEEFHGTYFGSIERVTISSNDIIVEDGDEIIKLSDSINFSADTTVVRKSENGYMIRGVCTSEPIVTDGLSVYEVTVSLSQRSDCIMFRFDIRGEENSDGTIDGLFFDSLLVPIKYIGTTTELIIPDEINGNYQRENSHATAEITDTNIKMWVYAVGEVDVLSLVENSEGKILYQNYDPVSNTYDFVFQYMDNSLSIRITWALSWQDGVNAFNNNYSVRTDNRHSATGTLRYVSV